MTKPTKERIEEILEKCFGHAWRSKTVGDPVTELNDLINSQSRTRGKGR